MPDSVMPLPSLHDDDLVPSAAPLGLPEWADGSLAPCRCDSWFCPTCRVHKALKLRSWLEGCASSLFPNPRLLTCTVDPKLFDSPRSAYEFVRSRRFISRLLGLFGVRSYIVVMECHKSGWPHWHVLFNAPKSRIDFRRLHRLWDKWSIGKQIQVSIGRKGVLNNPVHAIRYITKYLLKGCKWPDWVLDMPRIRIFSTSRVVGAFNVRPASDKCSNDSRKVLERSTCRTIRERVENCCNMINVFRNDKYLTTLDVPWGLARSCCERVYIDGVGWRWLLVDWDSLLQVCRECGCNV